MRRGLLVGLLAFIVLAQVSLLPALRPLGVVPNLVMVAVILVGVRGTVSQALWTALAGGLVLDLAEGTNFGLQTGLLMLAGLATGLVHRTGLAADGLVAPALLVTVAAAATNVVLAASIAPVTGPAVILPAVTNLIAESVLMLAVMLVLRPVIGLLLGRDAMVLRVGQP